MITPISPISPEDDVPETVPPVAGRAVGGATARERSRRRKAIYVVAIIVLIVVLFALGFPSTVSTEKTKGRRGGLLAQYRDNNGLSQTELGEVDPMSETVRLGLLGMRGVGSSILWASATQFQMKKDWTQLRATLDQISKLQPHSIAVWRFQAWNLSYNVSVAFDDYHDKFFWVIEGLNYMLEGVRLNDKEPRLYWDMGWFISNKIGRADEAKYYRRLFAGKQDTSETAADFRRGTGGDSGRDFSPDYVKDFRDRAVPPTGFPLGADVRDNWHVGKAWFLASESKIDMTPKWPGGPPRCPVRGMADVIFYSDAPTCQFYYADNLEKDGRFDQVAVNAWKQATREWDQFGDRAIDTSYDMKLQLNRQEEMEATAAKDLKDLDAMAPGARQKLHEERLERLKKDHPDTWAAWNTPEEKRTAQQNQLVFDVADKLEVKNDEVARAAPAGEKRQAALKLAAKIDSDMTIIQYVKNERSKVNFDFWRTRADAEQSEECIAARKAIHDGDEAFAKGDQIRALPLYEKGMRGWRKVLDRHPSLVVDPSLGGDLLDVIHRYQKCLDQDDRDLPKDFPLRDIIKAHERGGGGG
jgi:hypothetical protein